MTSATSSIFKALVPLPTGLSNQDISIEIDKESASAVVVTDPSACKQWVERPSETIWYQQCAELSWRILSACIPAGTMPIKMRLLRSLGPTVKQESQQPLSASSTSAAASSTGGGLGQKTYRGGANLIRGSGAASTGSELLVGVVDDALRDSASVSRQDPTLDLHIGAAFRDWAYIVFHSAALLAESVVIQSIPNVAHPLTVATEDEEEEEKEEKAKEKKLPTIKIADRQALVSSMMASGASFDVHLGTPACLGGWLRKGLALAVGLLSLKTAQSAPGLKMPKHLQSSRNDMLYDLVLQQILLNAIPHCVPIAQLPALVASELPKLASTIAFVQQLQQKKPDASASEDEKEKTAKQHREAFMTMNNTFNLLMYNVGVHTARYVSNTNPRGLGVLCYLHNALLKYEASVIANRSVAAAHAKKKEEEEGEGSDAKTDSPSTPLTTSEALVNGFDVSRFLLVLYDECGSDRYASEAVAFLFLLLTTTRPPLPKASCVEDAKSSSFSLSKSSEKGPCFGCLSEVGTKCARCRLVWYCGKACQKKCWSHHRSQCVANPVSHN